MNRMPALAPRLAAALVLLAAAGCRQPTAEAPADAPPAPVGAAATSPEAASTAIAEPTEDLAAEAERVTQVVSSTFRAAMGAEDPEWEDVTVRFMSTDELAALRRQPGPADPDVRVARGSVWVVGFRTRLPVTLAQLPPDNPFDGSPEGALDASLAGPDGLTSVYYVLGTSQELGGPRQYTLLSRGILGPDAPWGIEDLAAAGSAP